MKNFILYGLPAALIIILISMLLSTCDDGGDDIPLTLLMIENVDGPKTYDCGGYYWRVRFGISIPPPTGGYFIQKITMTKQTSKTCPKVYTPINITYWEAWKVNPLKQVTIYVEKDPNDYDDQYSSPSWKKSEGDGEVKGELRFYEGITLSADFKANNPKTFAGILPSTKTKPSFWDDSGDSESHNLEISWDCCDTTVNNLITTPTVSGKIFSPEPPKGGTFFEFVEPLKPWTDSTGYTQADNELLLEMTGALSQLSDNEILNGCSEYKDYYVRDLDALSKLYLSLRVIYDVPQQVPIDDAKTFGGWMRPVETLNIALFDLLYPLGWSDYPVPVVMYPFEGYLGAPYDPVAEAQFFIENYGRRPM